jgi:hypothetical protein
MGFASRPQYLFTSQLDLGPVAGNTRRSTDIFRGFRAAGEDELASKAPLASTAPEAKARAEANFKKEERAKDGAKAMQEYLANSRLVRERMARLKALRLAKETTEKAADKG